MFSKVMFTLGIVLLALAAGCSQKSEGPLQPSTAMTEPSLDKLPMNGNFLALADTDNPSCQVLFGTLMLGRNEVPPRQTRAVGVAGFRLNASQDTAWYRLFVADIKNPVGAHIHLGPAGETGPIVVSLYSGAAGSGPFSGMLASGYFTASDFAGPFSGAGSFAGFVSALHHDSLYVNVHTDDGVQPPNTGPGDFPGGEIRGQLIAVPCKACSPHPPVGKPND